MDTAELTQQLHERNAKHLALDLLRINQRLTEYRLIATAFGFNRLAMSDLATIESLACRYWEHEDADERTIEAMARLLLDKDDPGPRLPVAWQDHEDEVSDALAKVGLLPYPDPGEFDA